MSDLDYYYRSEKGIEVVMPAKTHEQAQTMLIGTVKHPTQFKLTQVLDEHGNDVMEVVA